jgi:hypothetical protein
MYGLMLLSVIITVLFFTSLAHSQSDVHGKETVFENYTKWDDPFERCMSNFACSEDTTTGWNDGSSSLYSTSIGSQIWSGITSPEISGSAGKSYNVTTHMRLNEQAVQSHIVIEGFNGTAGKWYQVTHCPSGTDGPTEWREFKCHITIPGDTDKIRLKLNAGWSSSGIPNRYASTWFDDISLLKTN